MENRMMTRLDEWIAGVASAAVLALTSLAAGLISLGAAPSTAATILPGKKPGIESFRLTNMPDGSRPYQNWFCMGRDPLGSIYIGGMDHVNNSALYRFEPKTKTLSIAGDAKTAAREAGFLKAGETFEKFHTRPVHLDGYMYVTSMDNSDFNENYRKVESFHWFRYEIAAGKFEDLSKNDPGRSEIDNCQAVGGLLADTKRKYVYATGLPTAHLYRFDTKTGTTRDLGRPSQLPDQYVGATVFPWMDDEGGIYLSYSGSEGNRAHSAYNHLYYYNPETEKFEERKNFTLSTEGKAGPIFGATRLTHGAWTWDKKHLYVTNHDGMLYRFGKEGPTWERIGLMDFGPPHQDKVFATHTLHTLPDSRKILTVNSHWSSPLGHYYIVEYDPDTRTSRNLVDLNVDMPEAAFNSVLYHAGDDLWDEFGYMYFTSFQMSQNNAVVTRFNPWIYAGKETPSALVRVAYRDESKQGTMLRLVPGLGSLIEGWSNYDLSGRAARPDATERNSVLISVSPVVTPGGPER